MKRWTNLYDGPEQEHGGDGGRRPPLEVDCDEGGDEADDGGVARRERLARVSLVLRRALVEEFRVTILRGNNLPLTWIWDVPPSCLGSR